MATKKPEKSDETEKTEEPGVVLPNGERAGMGRLAAQFAGFDFETMKGERIAIQLKGPVILFHKAEGQIQPLVMRRADGPNEMVQVPFILGDIHSYNEKTVTIAHNVPPNDQRMYIVVPFDNIMIITYPSKITSAQIIPQMPPHMQ